MSTESLTPRERQTLNARKAFEARFASPEERESFFERIGQQSAERRLTLSAAEREQLAAGVTALNQAYVLLAGITARAERKAAQSPDPEHVPEPNLTFESIAVVVQQIEFAVRKVTEWAGPSPDSLEQYGQINPAIIDKIFQAFDRESQLEVDVFEHHREIDRGFLKQYEREQELREVESREDIATRKSVLGFGKFLLFLLVLLGFIAAIFGPFENDYARVATATVFISPILVLSVVVCVRGRMTSVEGDILQKVLPALAEKQGNNRSMSSQAGNSKGTALDEG